MASPKYLFIAPAVLAIAATSASAVHVNIELSLLVDVSASIDSTEVQPAEDRLRQCIYQPQLLLVGGRARVHSVAINCTSSGQVVASRASLSGWTLISSQAQATAFGNAIAATTRPFGNGGNTSPGESAIEYFAAVNTGTQNIFNNSFDSDKQILDVSGGDGARERPRQQLRRPRPH